MKTEMDLVEATERFWRKHPLKFYDYVNDELKVLKIYHMGVEIEVCDLSWWEKLAHWLRII